MLDPVSDEAQTGEADSMQSIAARSVVMRLCSMRASSVALMGGQQRGADSPLRKALACAIQAYSSKRVGGAPAAESQGLVGPAWQAGLRAQPASGRGLSAAFGTP